MVKSILLSALATFAGLFADAAWSSSLEDYASALERSILERDWPALKVLIGNEELTDDSTFKFALGGVEPSTASKFSNLHQFLSDRNFSTRLEMTIRGTEVHGMIFWVRNESMPPDGKLTARDLHDLKYLEDVIACEVVRDAQTWRMPESFCYYETDAFSSDNQAGVP